eukprot:TRINITY_DN0_c0_g2_i13.p4 TRINITY_DN0_c0_g2~~TRINITY_DN0_c0_g2_i13.p4  ORF type:complete len:100 (-),score=10.09 TRINITY_DN0_c0_g2_i13:82-381(-)
MVNVTSKKCVGVDEGGAKCTRQPSFGVLRGKAATHCAAHKTSGMVDVRSKRCTGVDEGGAKCTSAQDAGHGRRQAQAVHRCGRGGRRVHEAAELPHARG